MRIVGGGSTDIRMPLVNKYIVHGYIVQGAPLCGETGNIGFITERLVRNPISEPV